jgi:hypothetical protein
MGTTNNLVEALREFDKRGVTALPEDVTNALAGPGGYFECLQQWNLSDELTSMFFRLGLKRSDKTGDGNKESEIPKPSYNKTFLKSLSLEMLSWLHEEESGDASSSMNISDIFGAASTNVLDRLLSR